MPLHDNIHDSLDDDDNVPEENWPNGNVQVLVSPPIEEELDVDAIFAEAARQYQRDQQQVIQNPEQLTEIFISFYNRPVSPFLPGELLTWKPAMRNRRVPEYGQPCVIMRVLEPIEHEITGPNGTLYAWDVVDLEIGLMDDDGDLAMFAVDSRRLMHWEPPL